MFGKPKGRESEYGAMFVVCCGGFNCPRLSANVNSAIRDLTSRGDSQIPQAQSREARKCGDLLLSTKYRVVANICQDQDNRCVEMSTR